MLFQAYVSLVRLSGDDYACPPGGIGLVIAGVYMLLATAIGSGLAALIVGVVVSLLAVILMVTVKSSM